MVDNGQYPSTQPPAQTIAGHSDKRDTKRIRPDQERETANDDGKVDLMHGDLSERPQFDSVIH